MNLWDPQQREWLQAMGHSLWVLASDEAVPEADGTNTVPAAGSGRGVERPEPVVLPGSDPVEPKPARRPRAPAPPVPESPATEASLAAHPRTDAATKAAALEAARMGAARNADGPLREALLRATGQLPAVAARTLRDLDVDQAALRDDPATKRVLWRRLRQLRKAAG